MRPPQPQGKWAVVWASAPLTTEYADSTEIFLFIFSVYAVLSVVKGFEPIHLATPAPGDPIIQFGVETRTTGLCPAVCGNYIPGR